MDHETAGEGVLIRRFNQSPTGKFRIGSRLGIRNRRQFRGRRRSRRRLTGTQGLGRAIPCPERGSGGEELQHLAAGEGHVGSVGFPTDGGRHDELSRLASNYSGLSYLGELCRRSRLYNDFLVAAAELSCAFGRQSVPTRGTLSSTGSRFRLAINERTVYDCGCSMNHTRTSESGSGGALTVQSRRNDRVVLVQNCCLSRAGCIPDDEFESMSLIH